MSQIEFDETRWPILHMRFPARFDAKDWADHLERNRQFVMRNSPFAVVCDIRGAQNPDASMRKQGADFWAEPAILRHGPKAVAYVCDNALLRGALTAMAWLKKPAWPTRVFADIERAEGWTRQHL